MSLPWHIPLETAPPFNPLPKQPQPSLIKHFCNVDVHGYPSEELKIGLMCEISPLNKEVNVIQRLIAAGMTIALVNINDSEPVACGQMIQSLRHAVYNYSIELEYAYPLAVMIEIREPDVVTGDLKSGPETTIELSPNNAIKLTTDSGWRECGTAECLYVSWAKLPDMKIGDEVIIDSLTPNNVRMVVKNISDDTIKCNVTKGGIIGARAPVKILNATRTLDTDNLDAISCKSKADLGFDSVEDKVAWAVGSEIDALLIPKCEDVSQIRKVQDLLQKYGKQLLIFSSIETVLGIDNFDDILKESDGIVLNRCNLSIDLKIERIFVAQKKIFAKCNQLCKPLICKAVLNEQVPMFCVTDIANLVADGADVLFLDIHYESPFKKISLLYDSVQSAENCIVATGVICSQAERVRWRPNKLYGKADEFEALINEPSMAICVSAVELAMRVNAVVIICLTHSGRTPKIISSENPPCPVIAVTRDCRTARQLRFWRGVKPMHYFETEHSNYLIEVEYRIHSALDYCKLKGLIRAGDAFVVLSGSNSSSVYCDSIRLLYASDRETLIML